MLIDKNGKKVGIVSFETAIEEAKNSSLDLVQMSSSGENPIVCKLLDYGKHIFYKKKSKAS